MKRTIGERLRALREEAKLTQDEAGEIAGTTKQSVSQIENGRTKVPGGLFVYRWAKRYGVSLEWLITGEGPRTAGTQLDPELLVEAETLVLGQEMALGHRYPKQDRAVRLAHAYAHVAAQGGRVDAATNAALLDDAVSHSVTPGGSSEATKRRSRGDASRKR